MAEEIESHRRRHAAEEAESYNDDNVYKARLDEVRCVWEAMWREGALCNRIHRRVASQ